MTLTEISQPPRPVVPFAATVSSEGASSVVALRGEADVYTLPAVVAELARVISEYDGPVIVDLADTTFIDVGTVRAIGRASQFLDCRGRTLTVRGPSRMAARLLAFLGLSGLVKSEPPKAA